jgi:hypothetical protein
MPVEGDVLVIQVTLSVISTAGARRFFRRSVRSLKHFQNRQVFGRTTALNSLIPASEQGSEMRSETLRVCRVDYN